MVESATNDAAGVAELQQQLANAHLCAEQSRIAADQLKVDNNRSVVRLQVEHGRLLSK